MKQERLSPITKTETWPKNHKITLTKKFFQKDYPVKSTTFEGIINEAGFLGIDTFIAGYSGGKDSGMVVDKLYQANMLDGVFHIRTNTGVQVTEDFVIDQCQSLGVKLDIREPTPLAYAYVAFCLEFGFPGPKLHSSIMKILKYRTMKKYVQEPQFKNKHPAIVAGVRKTESTRRFASAAYNSPITQETGLWFVNPLFYESDENVYRYFIENNLKRSPSYDTLGFSGECMCGCYAGYDEAKLLEQVDPKRFAMMQWITEGIKKFGTNRAKRHAKWGATTDLEDSENQEVLERFFSPDEIANIDKMAVMACGDECGPGTMNGMENY
jgi:3'-phosphoadenosine 5'-phosphosulfate sulfotransferase (PAPS reductase)/FAD synthetase